MASKKMTVCCALPFFVALTDCGHKSLLDTQADVFVGSCVAPTSASDIPATLTQTGCFTALGTPSDALFSYTVNAPLWANGADKGRYLLLPAGQVASFDANGLFVPPIGTVVFKEFDIDNVRLETRLLWYSAEGSWNGYSYAWNADQNVATLLADGETATVDGQSWTYPTRANCLTCHNAVAGGLLGVRIPELSRTVATKSSSSVNQLQAMADANLIKMPEVDPNTVWSDPLGDAPLALRARSYLAANCSYCHRPGGQSGTQTDFTYGAALANMGACNVSATRGNLGNPNAMLIAPGDANNSIVSLRMHSNVDGQRMPPIGRDVVDIQGAAVVDTWINSLTNCQ